MYDVYVCVCVDLCVYHEMFVHNMLDNELVEHVYSLQIMTAPYWAAESTRSGFSAQQEERKLSKLIGANNLPGWAWVRGDIACHNMFAVPNTSEIQPMQKNDAWKWAQMSPEMDWLLVALGTAGAQYLNGLKIWKSQRKSQKFVMQWHNMAQYGTTRNCHQLLFAPPKWN